MTVGAAPGRQFGWGRAFRLRKHVQFCRVQSKGRRVGGRYVAVVCSRSDLPGPRFGLTVSRHVGDSVVRNRVKRMLRDILRHRKTSLSGCRMDFVFIARPDAASARYADLDGDVAVLLERVLAKNGHVRVSRKA